MCFRFRRGERSGLTPSTDIATITQHAARRARAHARDAAGSRDGQRQQSLTCGLRGLRGGRAPAPTAAIAGPTAATVPRGGPPSIPSSRMSVRFLPHERGKRECEDVCRGDPTRSGKSRCSFNEHIRLEKLQIPFGRLWTSQAIVCERLPPSRKGRQTGRIEQVDSY